MSFETPVRVKRVAHVGAFIGDPYVAVDVVAAPSAAQPAAAASSSPGAGAVRSVRRRLEAEQAEEAEEAEDVDSLCVVGGGLCGAVSQLRVRECDRREHARRVKSSLSECERVSLSSCIDRGALNPGACVHPVLFRRAQSPATLQEFLSVAPSLCQGVICDEDGGFCALCGRVGVLEWSREARDACAHVVGRCGGVCVVCGLQCAAAAAAPECARSSAVQCAAAAAECAPAPQCSAAEESDDPFDDACARLFGDECARVFCTGSSDGESTRFGFAF